MYALLFFLLPFLTPGPVEGLLRRSSLLQENYQGEKIPTAYGLYLYFHLLFLLPLMAGDLFPRLFFFTLVTGGGFLDDCCGGGDHRGLKGHFRFFLEEKRFNTGLFKVLFSGMGAVYLLLPLYPFFLLDLLLLLTAINSMNLLDLRPGRAMKAFFFLLLPLLWLNLIPQVFFFFFLPFLLAFSLELQEQVMLGDTGSNLLGALLGFFLLSLPLLLRLLFLSFFLLLHMTAEFSSLSALIQRSHLLRRLDMLGRIRD